MAQMGPNFVLQPRTARVEELLKTNEPPLVREREWISDTAKGCSTRLKTLKGELAKARKTYEDLLLESHQSIRDLNDSKLLLHPIRVLSPEVLSLIFLFCIEEDWPPNFEDVSCSLDSKGAPWTLVQVCSRWRAVGLACSQLWSHIRIDFEWFEQNCTNTEREGPAFLLGLQLDRSRTRPLSIAIAANTTLEGEELLLLPLLSCSSRWETASLAIPWECYSEHLSSVKGFLPSLRRLYLETSGGDDSVADGMEGTYDAFEYAPQLRELFLSQYSETPDFTSGFLLPWTQIEEYTGYNVHSSSNLELLDRATALQDCDIECTLIDDFTRVIPPPLTSLHTLRISELKKAEQGGAAQLLDSLTLPALTSLKMHFGNAGGDIAFFPRLLRRSKCDLQVFELIIPELSDADLLTILKVLSSIKRLGLEIRKGVGSTILSKLLYKPGQAQACLLPSLEAIDTRGTTFKRGCYTQLLEAFSSRVGSQGAGLSNETGVSTLKTVRIGKSFFKDGRDGAIQKLRDAGLDISSEGKD